MPKRKGETAAQWYERAIVTNSLAASDLDDLDCGAEPPSQVLRRTVTKTARTASKDLDAALESLLAERGTPHL